MSTCLHVWQQLLWQSNCILLVFKDWLYISVSNCERYKFSCVLAANAIYSASYVDKAMVGCFSNIHEMIGPLSVRLKQYPVVLRLSFRSVTRSASLYARFSSPFLWHNSCFIFPFKYLGPDRYCDSFLTTQLKSGLVHVIAWIKLPIISQYFFGLAGSQSPSQFGFCSHGVDLPLQSDISNLSLVHSHFSFSV